MCSEGFIATASLSNNYQPGVVTPLVVSHTLFYGHEYIK